MVNKSKDIKRLKLREIADLTVGYSIPGRINDDPNGNVHLLHTYTLGRPTKSVLVIATGSKRVRGKEYGNTHFE